MVYDVEPDKNEEEEQVSALPKRVRFYHAKIDAESLKSGRSYRDLKNVVIIMITPYDPFGLNRMVYTIKSGCVEVPEMPYEDGAQTLFLYTKGTAGNPSEALRQLLQYMEHTTETNARNADLKEIQEMVKTVKKDEEVSIGYMKVFEREEMLINQGRREESINTERERKRANEAESRANEAEEEVRRLKEEIQKLKGNHA